VLIHEFGHYMVEKYLYSHLPPPIAPGFAAWAEQLTAAGDSEAGRWRAVDESQHHACETGDVLERASARSASMRVASPLTAE
jgi:hypothetical protein